VRRRIGGCSSTLGGDPVERSFPVQDDPQTTVEPQEKEPYEAPRVEALGTIRDLTAGVADGSTDSGTSTP
jgi:hypothetical protein